MIEVIQKKAKKEKKYKALGPNVVIKVNTQALDKIGSLYIPESKASLDQARAEVEIVGLGEDAFSDLAEANRPKVGDMVVIPRYEGIRLNQEIEDVVMQKKVDFELRIVADTRILAIVEELD